MNKVHTAVQMPDPDQFDGSNQAEPVRVAQILNRMDSGGIEAVVMNYYRHIDRSKVQFDFYVSKESFLPQRAELEKLGAAVYFIPSYRYPIAYHQKLYTAFKHRGYKIVHAHLNAMSVFPLFAAWRAGVPVRICHNHTTAAWSEGVKTLLKYILRPFCKQFSTEWFACGEVAGRWMYGNKAFDAGKVTIMPNAIDTMKFTYDSTARATLRDKLGIPKDSFVVGHVGRLKYQKNHQFLLKIFSELNKIDPDARLLLIGEGELENRIRQQIQAAGLQNRVLLMGARQDVDKLYSVMDVFCLPSRYEGMPVVAWEAQANGLPCVLSDKITTEADISRQVLRLAPENASMWRKSLKEKNRVTVKYEDIKEYDIQNEAKKMEQWWRNANMACEVK